MFNSNSGGEGICDYSFADRNALLGVLLSIAEDVGLNSDDIFDQAKDWDKTQLTDGIERCLEGEKDFLTRDRPEPEKATNVCDVYAFTDEGADRSIDEVLLRLVTNDKLSSTAAKDAIATLPLTREDKLETIKTHVLAIRKQIERQQYADSYSLQRLFGEVLPNVRGQKSNYSHRELVDELHGYLLANFNYKPEQLRLRQKYEFVNGNNERTKGTVDIVVPLSKNEVHLYKARVGDNWKGAVSHLAKAKDHWQNTFGYPVVKTFFYTDGFEEPKEIILDDKAKKGRPGAKYNRAQQRAEDRRILGSGLGYAANF